MKKILCLFDVEHFLDICTCIYKINATVISGAVFASLACVESAASVAGTVIANAIYDKTISFFKGFVFFVFVMCNAVSFILML